MARPASVFAATTGIAVIVAGYLWQQLHAERELVVQLQDQVAQLQVAQAQQPAERVVIREVEAQPKPGDQVAAPAEPGKASDGFGPPARSSALSLNSRELMKDPEYRAGLAMSLRGSLAQTYPDIAEVLNLTPEQTEKLFDLMVKQSLDGMANRPLDGADETTVRATAEARQRQLEEEMVALLGSSGHQQFQEYQMTLGARQQVTQLSAALTSSGDAMSDLQKRQLTTALVAVQKRQLEESRQLAMNRPSTTPTPREQVAMMEDNMKRTEEINRRMLDAASAYLNPQQLEAMRTMQNQSLAMSRAMLRAQRAQLEAQSQ